MTPRRLWGSRRHVCAAWLAVALALAGSAGCGFQPRGQVGATGQLEGTYGVAGEATNSPFSRALRRAIRASGGAWVEDPGTAETLIQVQRRGSESRVLSVDSRNRAVEYELEESVQFVLRSGSEDAPSKAQTVRVSRILFQPSDAILAGDRERELLRTEMRDDLAERVVRSIAARR